MAPHLKLSDIESLSLELVPGTGRADIQLLSSGLINETYRVVRDDRAYALRLAYPESLTLGLDRSWEAKIFASAAGAALAPPLLHADPQRGVLLTGWAAGRSWSVEEAGLRANIHKFAALLRRIHVLSVPKPARILSPMAWVDLYTSALARRARQCDPDLRSAAVLRSAELARLPGGEAALCHSDLHTMNLIESEGSLLLLDWEYAHVSEPLWDLAGWCANNDFEDEARRDLLMSYMGTAPTPAQWTRLGLLVSLYDYVCLLWSELYVSLWGDPGGRVSERATLLDARLHLPAH
jgi:thiamine kinase-like enzyme